MNTPAIQFESLGCNDAGLQLPKNSLWEIILNIKTQVTNRHAVVEMEKRGWQQIREIDERLIKSSNFVFYG